MPLSLSVPPDDQTMGTRKWLGGGPDTPLGVVGDQLGDMEMKEALVHYLGEQRGALLLKVDGLSERDARMPRTPTGTNLIGIVKHCMNVEYGYFGPTFGRTIEDSSGLVRTTPTTATRRPTGTPPRQPPPGSSRAIGGSRRSATRRSRSCRSMRRAGCRGGGRSRRR